MTKLFKHNDLRFYVRALFETAGIDVRYMVPDFQDVPQAEPEVIETILDQEDHENAEHMETNWLYHDRAREAIGMRQSDGYSDSANNDAWQSERAGKKRPKDAYIGLARTNADRTKEHLNNLPVSFEMKSNREEDAPAIQGVNRYRDEILNQNNWEAQKTKFIADGHDFGSGIMYNPYKTARAGTADRFFMEERARQGQPIEYEEFIKMKEFARSHVMRHIDTFDVIRDRRASGEDSMSFAHPMHTITTWMDTMTITEAMQRWPKERNRIQANISDVHRRINPQSCYLHRDDLLVTYKNTWVQCPVRYSIDVPVHVGNQIVINQKEWIERTAILRMERIEGIGIVGMHIDEYAHGELPLTMWQRRPSKIHAYGIGAYKDMWAAEWAYNIAFNGKFHWFNRMSKGTKYYYKGAISKTQINAGAHEQAWVEIDPNSLPAHLREQPISNLIYETRPPSFPSVYDNLEINMEDKVNRTSGWHDVAGKPSGTSGRQQMILENTAMAGQGPMARNLEMAFQPMGDKFFKNIIQFDGERTIEFTHEDPVTKERTRVELNVPEGEVPVFDEETGEFKLYAYHIRNSMKTLEWSTQIATRSIVPSNPTEQRFFWLETLNSIFPYTQSEEGLAFLDVLNRKVYDGLFTEMIEQQRAVFRRNAMMQQQAIENERQAAQAEQAGKRELDMVEAGQNKYRLEQKAASDYMKSLAALEKARSES